MNFYKNPPYTETDAGRSISFFKKWIGIWDRYIPSRNEDV